MVKGKNTAKKEKKVIEDEIFKVEKDGKEKIIRKEIFEEEKAPSDKQIKNEKKILQIIVITLIGLVLFFLAFLYLVNYSDKFKTGGVIFEVDSKDIAGKIIYKTSLPVYGKNATTGKINTAIYNIYLRNDPRKLEEITFDGNLALKKSMVINMTRDFTCEGDGTIGIANILNLYQIVGTSVIKDENATCDKLGRYTYVNIQEGEETKIEQYGPACYNIYVNNCEILPATEKFMLETLIEVNKKIN